MLTARRELKSRLQELRTVSLFARCTNRELARIDGLGTPVTVEPGRVLAYEGDAGRECFVTLTGNAAVERAGTPVATIAAGSVAGELALLDDAPRNATVVARTRMRLLVFTPGEFDELLRTAPSINGVLRQVADARRQASSGRCVREGSRVLT